MQISDRVAGGERHVARGFRVHTFDPARERLPARSWVKYKSRDGAHLFEFVPVRLPNGSYRAYIRAQPSYRDRASGATAVHRLQDQHGYYICWVPEPSDVQGLLKVMRVWAEATVGYLFTGSFAPLPDA